ncbi:PREDICTED: uncharacterized protein LOC109207577 [Nicotiana attenuata]|uniref:Werner syndrome-like exonuclease n=1 Tax=Nicotiana attenuata TaxID=49451 RepID=A0A1J6IMC5_NICAT|nr:PREDICTED: uncharacterized protein LOC109207577 [Nicotiana attenuata]OIT06006.1 hypothetical protein A4A49_40240 [Nicotiana attenuata]
MTFSCASCQYFVSVALQYWVKSYFHWGVVPFCSICYGTLILLLIFSPSIHTKPTILGSSHSSNKPMAGTVYLRTNRFEVKLEGITFKAKEFESLCTVDFLFPEGKIWVRPPVVGLDVMRHPRDPSIILVLFCFGVGCLILRFHSGEQLPDPVLKFLTDERIRFVGFGIPEKKDLFPFEELGLTKDKVDIGYLATKYFNNPKYKRCELGELARKVLGIKRMIGLTEASSFERHEQIKCAICQLFISTVIAMSLFTTKDKKKLADAPKKTSFLKNLSSLPLLSEGWFKLPKGKKGDKNLSLQRSTDVLVRTSSEEEDYLVDAVNKHKEGTNGNDLIQAKIAEFTLCDDSADFWGDKEDAMVDDRVQEKSSECKLDGVSPHVSGGESGSGEDLVLVEVSEHKSGDDSAYAKAKESSANDEPKEEALVSLENDDSKKEAAYLKKRPIKGILKCPSAGLEAWNSLSPNPDSPVSVDNAKISLRRANSKGYNVCFKEQWL